ncbi:aldose epimerase [Neisseria sp.]|uniref:aldose epimerase family protein n=1 Tax=Neisseria sp. TaxID=192066 RepID=UPI0035A0CF33
MPATTLQNRRACVRIDTRGAYIDTLRLAGRDVFFPKTMLPVNGTPKLRGGMHVCLPQFGMDADGVFDNHGFGRTLDWAITAQSQDAVRLLLDRPAQAGYAHSQWQLDYSLPDENRFSAVLTVRNLGGAPIRTTPGFHPYFHAESSRFGFNGETYDAADLGKAAFVDAGRETRAAFDGEGIVFATDNLPVYALWSDRNGSYICAEPTAQGNAFLSPADETQFVPPQGEKTYGLEIRWEHTADAQGS